MGTRKQDHRKLQLQHEKRQLQHEITPVAHRLSIDLLNRNAQGWYNSSLVSTSYTISDATRINLLIQGTLCGSYQAMKCVESLSDGHYIFRVTGSTDYRDSENAWEFCGVRGSNQQELSFSLDNGNCVAGELSFASDPNNQEEEMIEKPMGAGPGPGSGSGPESESESGSMTGYDSTIRYQDIVTDMNYQQVNQQTEKTLNAAVYSSTHKMKSTTTLSASSDLSSTSTSTSTESESGTEKTDSISDPTIITSNETKMKSISSSPSSSSSSSSSPSSESTTQSDPVTRLQSYINSHIQSLQRGEMALLHSLISIGVLCIVIFLLVIIRRNRSTAPMGPEELEEVTVHRTPIRSRKIVRFAPIGERAEIGESRIYPLIERPVL